MMISAVVPTKGDGNEFETIEMISVRQSLSFPQSRFCCRSATLILAFRLPHRWICREDLERRSPMAVTITSSAAPQVLNQVLQKAGLIQYRRGAVKVMNRRNLEKYACECYGTVMQFEVASEP